MAINQVQFQRGLSMSACMERDGTEEKCRAALEVSRWPDGFTCPRCQCQHHCLFYQPSRKYFQCPRYDRQTDARANRYLSDTALVLPDGLDCFCDLEGKIIARMPFSVGSGRPSNPAFSPVNTDLGSLKTAMSGTCKVFLFERYTARYLAETQYRFNHQYNLNSILTRLLRTAALNRPRPEKFLK